MDTELMALIGMFVQKELLLEQLLLEEFVLQEVVHWVSHFPPHGICDLVYR
jgi:hypothetical protein